MSLALPCTSNSGTKYADLGLVYWDQPMPKMSDGLNVATAAEDDETVR